MRLRNHGGGAVRFTVRLKQMYGPLSVRGANDDRGHANDTGATWTVTVRAGDQSELHLEARLDRPLVRLHRDRRQRCDLLAPHRRARRNGPALGQRSGNVAP
ncbi:hypothetical protein BLAT2472_50315 [Burkholderia latens]